MCAAENHLLWFDQKDMAEWLIGARKRAKFVEYHLPKLVAQKKLIAVQFGRKLVYRVYRPHNNGIHHLTHDLMCTKLIIRFGNQNAGEIVSELFFLEEKERFGCIPDWAVLYSSMVLLCEFSTADNFRRTHIMSRKLQAYRKYLHRFINYFDTDVSVLFIFDAPRNKVREFATIYAIPDDPFFYFTDLTSLKEAPKAKLLTSPLYIWGGDGGSYTLTS